jgi:hypothetical protein
MTDPELRDAAVAALKATTVSYPTWKKKVDQGTYPDVTKTKWWQAFDHLDKIAATPPPPSSLWDRFLEWYKTTPPVPLTPNKAATSEADARAKIAGIQTGDVLRVTGVTFRESGDRPCLELHNLPAGTIEFVNCYAVHTGRTLYPTVSHWRCSPASRVYGLDITGRDANCGIRTEDSAGLWWGFKIHDCGGTGLMTVATDRNDGPYDLRGEISNSGLRLDLDPHYEPGTGSHGAYIGGSADNAQGNSGTFVLHVHDQPYGGGIQLGSYVYDSTVVGWCERLTFNAQSQVAGNALQWWGGNLRNIRVPFIYGKELAGRVSETDGVYGGGAHTPIVHEFGRGERVCLNPRLTNVAFTPEPNFVYQDCTATY